MSSILQEKAMLLIRKTVVSNGNLREETHEFNQQQKICEFNLI